MTEIPIWVPLVSALAGGALVGSINFAMRWQDRKSEERRHLRELLLNAALEHWKQSTLVFIETMKKGQKVSLLPVDATIIHLMKLSEILMDSKITKDNIAEKLKEVHAVAREVEKFFKSQNESSTDNEKTT